MHQKKILIHIAHDLACTDGSVNAVLGGLINSPGYINTTKRSILIGPAPVGSPPAKKLLADDELLYTTSRGQLQHPYAPKLAEVERNFHVAITYARRHVTPTDRSDPFHHEILLIDTAQADIHPVNALKAWLYEEFGIESIPYEHDPLFDQYVKLAPAALATLRAIAAADPAHPGVIIAHGHPGIPTALAAMMDPLGSFKTIFYAHDVPTAKHMIQHHPGHDTMFYNLMNAAHQRNFYLHEIMGDHLPSYQNVLTRAARYCDHIIAASDSIRRELNFLGPELDAAQIDVTYTPLPDTCVAFEQRQAEKAKLHQYAQNLLGFRPDYLFTHVGPTEVNSGFWRDLRVLEHLDKQFQQNQKSAVYLLISTNSSVKKPGDIDLMETSWDWPVAHRETLGDLIETEIKTAIAVQAFNARSKNIKAVFINQSPIGNHLYLGRRVPADINITDFIQASDVDFHQSIYNPNLIPSLQTLLWGGLSVVTCFGCHPEPFNWLADKNQGRLPQNLILADYTRLDDPDISLEDIQAMTQQQRDLIEQRVSADIADVIIEKLPQNDQQVHDLIQQAAELQHLFSWPTLWKEFYLPCLNRAYAKRRVRQIA